ncbi:hypothetical protein Prudu_821S000100, partial [Prunus dulcis]
SAFIAFLHDSSKVCIFKAFRFNNANVALSHDFNLPKPQRVSFDDRLKESLKVLLQEETKKMEAKAKEEALRMEARTKQLAYLNKELAKAPKILCLTKLAALEVSQNGEHQQEEEKEEEKRDEEKEEEKEKKDEEKHDDKTSLFFFNTSFVYNLGGGIVNEVGDYSNMEAPSSLKSLCHYVETTLLPEDKILEFTIDKEVFGGDRETFLLPEDITQFAGMEEIRATVVAVYMRHLHDVLKQANMCSMVGFIDPATVSANSGTIAERSRLVAARLQKTDGEQIFMMPYNPGRHWILLIVRAKKETVYFLDPLPGQRVVDEIYYIHTFHVVFCIINDGHYAKGN